MAFLSLSFGYPEDQIYTVQEKAWTDEQAIMEWVDEVWGSYTRDPQRDRWGTYLLQDECYVHLMVSVNNQIYKLGTGVEIIPGEYTGSVQVLDKGLNKPFKGYLREEFEEWMRMNGSRSRPSRAEVAQRVTRAWDVPYAKEAMVECRLLQLTDQLQPHRHRHHVLSLQPRRRRVKCHHRLVMSLSSLPHAPYANDETMEFCLLQLTDPFGN
jgi:hypothetical protein